MCLNFQIVGEDESNKIETSTTIPDSLGPYDMLKELSDLPPEFFDMEDQEDASFLDERISEARKVLVADSGPYGSMKTTKVTSNANKENVSRISHILKASKLAITTDGTVIHYYYLCTRGGNRIKT